MQMWSSASGATEDLFKTTVQPILDSNRPPQINALGFRKVSLGTIPPKVRAQITKVVCSLQVHNYICTNACI